MVSSRQREWVRRVAVALVATAAATATVGPARAASAVFRRTDVPYGAESSEIADLYRPSGTTGRLPAVLIVHGGGWHSGSKEGWRARAEQIAAAGFVVMVPDYELASASTTGFPHQLHELKTAVTWLRANAATQHVDGRHIGALGSSAGGNLAAMLATDAYGPLDGGNRLGAAVTWSAMLDLATQPGLRDAIADYVGCHAGCQDVLEDASPLHHVSGGDTPMELFNSTHELVPLATVRAMDARLTAHAVTHKLIIYSGTQHGVSYGDRAIASTIKFFHTELG